MQCYVECALIEVSTSFGGRGRKRGRILVRSDFSLGFSHGKEKERTQRAFQILRTAHAKAESQEKPGLMLD